MNPLVKKLIGYKYMYDKMVKTNQHIDHYINMYGKLSSANTKTALASLKPVLHNLPSNIDKNLFIALLGKNITNYQEQHQN